MDIKSYCEMFQLAAELVDQNLLSENSLKIATGVYKDSVFLKVYKNSWATTSENPLTAESRIFFSIWVEESSLRESNILYNIHAFKLRQLKGYGIQSRTFADTFRADFEKYVHLWPNVSVAFGPQTLLQGWIKINTANFQKEILELVYKFIDINFLIDNNLQRYSKNK